jgi:hypothetical protein
LPSLIFTPKAETSVNLQRTAWHCILEDATLRNHFYEDLKSDITDSETLKSDINFHS